MATEEHKEGKTWMNYLFGGNDATTNTISGGRRRKSHHKKRKCSKGRKRTYKGGYNSSETLSTLGYSELVGGKKTCKRRKRKRKC